MSSSPPQSGPDRLPSKHRFLDGVPPTVILLGAVSFLNDLSSEMIGDLIPIFLSQVLGTATVVIGLIEGVVAAASSLLRPLSGWVSDHTGRRKPWLLVGYWMAACARPIMAVSTAGWHILGLRFADRVGKGLRSAPRDALIADSTTVENRGKSFGVHRALDNAGAALGLLAAALVLWAVAGSATFKLRTLFWAASVPGIAVIALIIWAVREKPDPPRQKPPGTQADRLRSILTPPLLKWYLIVFVFWLGNSADGFLLLKAASVMGGESKLGAALWQMPLLAFVMSAVAAVFSSHAGAASDTLGRRRVLLLGWLLYAACYAGFAFARAPWVFYVLFGVYGLYYALTGGVERALVSDLTPKGARGTALGAYQCVAGVAALAASVICGWLWGIEVIGGPKAALGFGALCSLAAAALLLILNPMGARPTRAEKSP